MYPGLRLEGVRPEVVSALPPLFEELLMGYGGRLDSLYVVGSALAPDFDPQRSDVNSLVCLKELSFEVLDFLAQQGPRFGRKRVRAPLLMTPRALDASRDSYPIELLDLKNLHRTCY